MPDQGASRGLSTLGWILVSFVGIFILGFMITPEQARSMHATMFPWLPWNRN